MKSFMVEVIADESGQWLSNTVRFQSEYDANEWGEGLFMRWKAVREWRVTPSEDEPNRYSEGNASAVKEKL